jgi:hypothetical protein
VPTADEPKVSVRLDFRTHGALLDEAKRQQRKPATLVRMFVQERLGTVGRASGAPESPVDDGQGRTSGLGHTSGESLPTPAEPEPYVPEWKKRLSVGRRSSGPIPKGEK